MSCLKKKASGRGGTPASRNGELLRKTMKQLGLCKTTETTQIGGEFTKPCKGPRKQKKFKSSNDENPEWTGEPPRTYSEKDVASIWQIGNHKTRGRVKGRQWNVYNGHIGGDHLSGLIPPNKENRFPVKSLILLRTLGIWFEERPPDVS